MKWVSKSHSQTTRYFKTDFALCNYNIKKWFLKSDDVPIKSFCREQILTVFFFHNVYLTILCDTKVN